MIVVRMARGITEHMPARAAEWALAVVLFNWGWILLRDSHTFSSPAFAELARWASEDTWGYACLIMGGLRLVALVVNGTFNTVFRHSPHVRAAMAFTSCLFWSSISLGILKADVPTTGLAVYPVLLVLDMYNAMRASSDARAVDDEARRNAGIP